MPVWNKVHLTSLHVHSESECTATCLLKNIWDVSLCTLCGFCQHEPESDLHLFGFSMYQDYFEA